MNVFAGCVDIESVFELVSSEDQAKMEAAKMQADLAQSQQQKQVSFTSDGLPSSGKASTDSSTGSSQTVTTPENVNTTSAVVPFSSHPSLSHAGFTPFAKNPAKQKRYEAYLESVKNGTSCKFTAISAALFLWKRSNLLVMYCVH